MCNLLKLDYCNQQIYTFDEMVHNLDMNNHIYILLVSPRDFLNF